MATLEDSSSTGRDDENPPELDVPVTAHQGAPGQTVFVEEDNTDGWISSSLTVELGR